MTGFLPESLLGAPTWDQYLEEKKKGSMLAHKHTKTSTKIAPFGPPSGPEPLPAELLLGAPGRQNNNAQRSRATCRPGLHFSSHFESHSYSILLTFLALFLAQMAADAETLTLAK